MRALALLLAIAACGGGGESGSYPGDDSCDISYDHELSGVDPQTLECARYRYGYHCSESCEQCPTDSADDVPAWPACGSECLDKSQSDCEADASCRVLKEAFEYYGSNPSNHSHDPYLACFPRGLAAPAETACAQLDADACSSTPACTAIIQANAGIKECPHGARTGGCTTVEFVACVAKELEDPGLCDSATSTTVTCANAPPACPAGSAPGVASGCYTGACIPEYFCHLGHG